MESHWKKQKNYLFKHIVNPPYEKKELEREPSVNDNNKKGLIQLNVFVLQKQESFLSKYIYQSRRNKKQGNVFFIYSLSYLLYSSKENFITRILCDIIPNRVIDIFLSKQDCHNSQKSGGCDTKIYDTHKHISILNINWHPINSLRS